MKKVLLSVSLLLFTAVVFVPHANASIDNPWERVWNAIEHLRDQIRALHLTPGPEGPAGPAGQTGATGPQGPQGLQGLPGADGAPGVAGFAGEPGATGSVGLAGEPGAIGPIGPQGLQGIQGPAGSGSGSVALDRARTYKTTVTTVVPAHFNNDAVAACNDENDVLLSGGASGFYYPANITITRSEAFPFTLRQTWVVSALNTSASDINLTAFAFCYRVD